MPTKYYRVHGGKVSFAEYWRMSPNTLTFGIAAIAKLFGGLPMNFSIPRPSELHVVDWDDVPKAARKAMRTPIEELESAGLMFQFCHQLPVLERTRLGIGVVLLSPDGKTFATVNHAADANANLKETQVSCVSRFVDEGFGCTTSAKKQFKPIPEDITFRHLDMPADELYERHLDYLAGWEDDGRKVRRFNSETVHDVMLEGEQRHVDFHVERGVYVPMTKAEIRRIREEQEGADEDDEE